ncbi:MULTISPECIES: FadR/GntR family transcriptional regulator [Burkholderia]|uniref:GntR family transcriptional regulator n=1 Tax=Burkholderia diffusa TaxID=488732 RepID=A0A6P2HP26_9BURK|nr:MULTISPECIES: FadR/GntR family transcriptional regulator [Burkholderia]AOI98492.1 GntR family transcriptional regulator [Burkholderia sp. LA-2-3-30-S1-D2]KAB0657050.1 FadR family transcriptional regulator [Burkholderia diffusa]KVE20101.1 GntR family transcriptional regulator [Burkholderia sp. LA-2-3-30-S1-D2]MBM2652410.1 FadR family transcriptional regulator [Burkholderia diffusa]RQR82469.1 FadR family transcriptional regulator [Burkholderia sp. Bp9012]
MSVPTLPAAPRRRARSLAQDVVDALTAQIENGTLRPGDKLPTETEVMAAQGVSRTVVREAISRMQASGLVETRHGIGSFVLEPTRRQALGIDPATITTLRDVLAVLELRISLESECASLAAQRANDTDLAALRRALDAIASGAGGGRDTAQLDFQFHLQIAQSTGNRYFVDIMTQLGASIIPRTRVNSARFAGDDLERYVGRLNHEHEDIYEAIARHDPEAARAAMRTHLTNSRERLRRAHEAAEAERDTQAS